MKKNKILSAVCAMAMSCACFSSVITANANEPDLSFVYNKSKSTTSSAVIDVVVSERTAVAYSIQFGLIVSDATISTATYTASAMTATSNVLSDRISMNAYGDHIVADSGTTIGTITLNFAEPLTKDVVVSVTDAGPAIKSEYIAFENADYTGDIYLDNSVLNAITINVDGPTPSVVEIPAEDKGSFITHADPHVKAFAATIPSFDSSKTIKWELSNSEGKTYSETAVIGTEVTGGAEVTLGLKIVGDIDQVSSAKITIE